MRLFAELNAQCFASAIYKRFCMVSIVQTLHPQGVAELSWPVCVSVVPGKPAGEDSAE